jgi:hypothetical protein
MRATFVEGAFARAGRNAMRSKRALWTAVVVGAGIVASAAPDGVAATAHRRLILTGFLQLGRTDVGRNEILEFRFSVPLRADSVSGRTLMVNELIPDGEKPAVGARIVSGNTVRFDPRRSQRNYDDAILPNSVVVERDHELGFTARANYMVRIRSGPDVTTLRATSGVRIANAFTTSFGTGDRYYDDPVPGQPFFGGDGGAGLVGFDPPRHEASGAVDDDASLVFGFSEPILPSSMRLGETVLVMRASTGAAIPGALYLAPGDGSGRRYLFTPTGGWSAATDGHPYDVAVHVTTGVTDLVGNPLRRPF